MAPSMSAAICSARVLPGYLRHNGLRYHAIRSSSLLRAASTSSQTSSSITSASMSPSSQSGSSTNDENPLNAIKLWDEEAGDMTDEAMQVFERPGVYFVYAKDGHLQYIGLSRLVAGTLKAHAAQFGPGAAWSACIESLPEDEEATQEALQELWKATMLSHIQAGNAPPPGNGRGPGSWGRSLKIPKRPPLQLRRQAAELNAQSDAPTSTLIEAAVQSRSVVAFIKGTRAEPECGFSAQVVNLLDSCRADFDVVDVLDEVGNPPDLRDTLKEFTTWPTVPQVFASGEFLGGSDILTEMHASGLLVRVVASAGQQQEQQQQQQQAE